MCPTVEKVLLYSRLISEKFNIAKSTAWVYVHKVCSVLTVLIGNYISWPKRPAAYEIMQKFEDRHGFPGVLGAMDGTHIAIATPSHEQASYCNRHQYHSIILQGICNSTYMFTDVFTGNNTLYIKTYI